MPLMPKRVKFRKSQRGVIKGHATRGNYVAYGDFGLQSLEAGWLSAESIEAALRALAERLGLSPRKAFQPIRVAVTGSTVSPGLFESIELLGRETSLQRIRTGLEASSS